MRLPAILLLLAATTAVAAPVPNAPSVVVRGKSRLDEACLAAIPRTRRVLVVVDSTPYTRRAGPGILSSLRAVAAARPGMEWRFGALGKSPGKAIRDPGDFGPELARALRAEIAPPSTMRALRATASAFSDGAVLYLADWRFEDDEELEAFVGLLVRRRLSLGVVGSEAAFGRGWNDGFFPPNRGARDARGQTILYDRFVGRNPFAGTRDAPWHGGDSAYPHVPMHYQLRWSTIFPAERRPAPDASVERNRYAPGAGGAADGDRDLEDLRERVGDVDESAVERYWFPLPSGFGPYGLMRAAGASGGKYVLWSWNPSGRVGVRYEYWRCNQIAPDLRDRATIRRDIRRRPLARALVAAWHDIANDSVQAASVTAPFARGGFAPEPMVEARGRWPIAESFDTPGDLKAFFRNATATLDALDGALVRLRAARRAAGPARDTIDRRYAADADLFAHVLAVLRWQLAEGVAAARTIASDAWDDPTLVPVIEPRWWIAPEREGDGDVDRDVAPDDPDSGAAVRAERNRLLERFRATPIGEMVRRNGVVTYRAARRPRDVGRPAREAPADSTGPKPLSTPPSAPVGGAESGR